MFGRASISRAVYLFLVIFLLSVTPSMAQERLCDPSFEDCRQQLWDLIDSETVEIDFAFWYISDSSYVTKLINKFRSGVKVRIIVDPKANPSKTSNVTFLDQLQAAGIPMRFKSTPFDSGGILHMKMMLFAGQNKVQFGTGNYSPASFVTSQPYFNYTLNALYFTDDPAIVNSYKTHFDDLWTDTANYSNYANVSGSLIRQYPTYPIDPALVYPPGTTGVDFDAFATRSVSAFNQETQKIDAAVYRIDDQRFSDAMIAAVNRNVPVRILMEPDEYRNPIKLWDAYNIDRMYAAGVQIKKRVHQGQMHQKSAIAYSQALAIFGSSNWTENSSNAQAEEDYFTTKPWMFNWFVNQFESKWNSSTEYQPFTPLAPDQPVNQFPANAATGESTTIKLMWQGGLWAHKYDIYFGTSPTPPLIASDVAIGSPSDGVIEAYEVSNLALGTTYYWRVVGKTMANQTAAGPTWRFTTASLLPLPLPTVSSISSSSGTGNGGTAVTLNGANYSSGATVMIGGALATNTTVVSGSTITATTPAHSAGIADVSVVNPDGQMATLPAAYRYTEPSLLNAPSLTSILPNSGPAAGGNTVIISGANFLPGVTVRFGAQAAPSVGFNSSTSISVTAPANLAGPMDVVVTNYDGASAVLSAGYSYTGTPGPAPVLTTVSPSSGLTSGGTSVAITGSGFGSGATVSFGGLTATNVVVTSSSSISVTSPAHAAGAVSVVVTNMDGQSATLPGGFTYIAPNIPPTISITGPPGGSSFTAPANIALSADAADADGAVVKVDFYSGANLIGMDASSPYSIVWTNVAAGSYSVTAVATDNAGATTTSNPITLTVDVPNAPPAVNSVSPNSGPVLGGTAITITGTGFMAGATVSIGGVVANAINVLSSTSITATTPANAAGTAGVSVTNSDGQSGTLAAGFTYRAPAPTLSAISPNTGTTAGGTSVTITGSNFAAGAAVTFGGAMATNINVISGTSITASTPPHAAGAVTVTVTNSDGQAGSRANVYTYSIAPPSAASNLKATAVSATQINLSWNDNSSNEDGFAIEQSTDGSTFSEIGRVGVNVKTFSSVNLIANRMYYYRVRAFNTGGYSIYSNVANVKTQHR